MAVNGKVIVDIQFNPETKELEQVIEDQEGKSIKKKIELDKGSLEGPLKDIQEFAARLSSGGISKGLLQIKGSFQEFGNLARQGADTSTALAGGLSKIGVEGGAVIASIAAIAAGTLAAIVAFAAFDNAAAELDRKLTALNLSAEEYSISLSHGV